MNTSIQVGAPLRAAVHLEAARILRAIIEKCAFVRPMPDGRVLLEVEADDRLLERIGGWGSQLTELEPDSDFEADARELPRLVETVPTVEAPAQASPALAELVSLQPVPPALTDLAARINADAEPAIERLAA